MKLEEAKTMQYVFQSNLNERSRGRTKSEEQKMALQNIKLFYEWQETVSKIALTKVKANKKLTKWNETNYIFFVLIKRNY